MIGWLRGEVVKKLNDSVLLNVQNVGYRVLVSQPVLKGLNQGETVSLYIHTQVKEDAIILYGFLNEVEQEAFEALIDINGIGPKVAITILSGIEATEFARAVCTEDLARLCLIPGVGKKKAERLVLELKERLVPLARSASVLDGTNVNALEDLRSALSNLGFRAVEIEKVVGALRSEMVEGVDLEIMMPKALMLLRG